MRIEVGRAAAGLAGFALAIELVAASLGTFGISGLVAKSLVTADLGGPATSYRLLGTTRDYLQGKLGESGEIEATMRRYAAFYREAFENAEGV